VLLNDQTGKLTINKCLTTPKDPSDAVEQGVRELEVKVPGFVEKLDEVIHGTTLVINSIIERKGARTGSSPPRASGMCWSWAGRSAMRL